MARRRPRALAASLGLALVLVAAVSAAGADGAATTWLDVVPPAQVRLAGRSNLAPWSCRSQQVAGTLEVAADRAKVLAAAASVAVGESPADDLPVPTFTLTVPVASLRCGNRVMERDLSTAVRAELHPVIAFHLTDVRGAPQKSDGEVAVTVTGVVSLNGVERPIELEVLARRLDELRFRARTELPLQMSWFGVTPPRGLFGLVRAEDALRVHLDLTLNFQEEFGHGGANGAGRERVR